MAGVYDGAIATAKKLIDKFGMDCGWQRPAAEVEAEPGYPTTGALPAVIPVRMAFFSPRDLGRGTDEFMAALAGTEVSGSNEIGLLAGGLSFEPDDQDSIIRNGVGLSIKKIDRLAPAGVPVIYYVSLAG